MLIALLAVVPGVSASSPNTAPPTVTLSPAVGPPTSTVHVSGTHFDSYEVVDVYLDTTGKALVATNGQGMFSLSIQIPDKAVPGKHWVTAVGRHSGRSSQAPFKVQTDWAQLGYDPQHTSDNPYENVINPTNVAELNVAWLDKVKGYSLPLPVVANGVVYVGADDGVLSALNAQTGAKLWSIAPGGDINTTPAVANGVVYIAAKDGQLSAVNAQIGVQLWFAAAGNIVVSSPVVVNGVVYIGSNNDNKYGYVYAYALPPGDQTQPPAQPNPATLQPDLKLSV